MKGHFQVPFLALFRPTRPKCSASTINYMLGFFFFFCTYALFSFTSQVKQIFISRKCLCHMVETKLNDKIGRYFSQRGQTDQMPVSVYTMCVYLSIYLSITIYIYVYVYVYIYIYIVEQYIRHLCRQENRTYAFAFMFV